MNAACVLIRALLLCGRAGLPAVILFEEQYSCFVIGSD